ncbi:11558_t:CDS:2 [Scutellospora calospora]|uniref:11558_t:CDS:1 n=1 Tax=Scutellospora calospora TaxID=85575 RepID=A0ACA9KHC5_9GLOM|nr:11558_t:CDS:2 [Scutellospora calospora]
MFTLNFWGLFINGKPVTGLDVIVLSSKHGLACLWPPSRRYVATLTLKPEPPKAQGTAKRGKPVLQQQAERPVDGKNPRDISYTGRHLSLPCKRENSPTGSLLQKPMDNAQRLLKKPERVVGNARENSSKGIFHGERCNLRPRNLCYSNAHYKNLKISSGRKEFCGNYFMISPTAILSRNAGYWRLSISPLRYIGVVANVSIMEMDIQIASYDLPIGQRYSEATQQNSEIWKKDCHFNIACVNHKQRLHDPIHQEDNGNFSECMAKSRILGSTMTQNFYDSIDEKLSVTNVSVILSVIGMVDLKGLCLNSY